ncbi:MAG TPA: CocE/NonD family hydrolase [Ilumatobacteraceae bacterium]|nr:CocE/NonD family hydrolase [Ilumatobacteraceae bacterium]
MRARLVPFVAAAITFAACSGSDGAAPAATSAPTTSTAVTTPAPTTESSSTAPLSPATFIVRAGTEQIAVLGGVPGDTLAVTRGGTEIASGTVDEQGSLLFRNLDAGGAYSVSSADSVSETVTVGDPADNPPASFYAEQEKLPEGGFGYITTRDGTTLSANVLLPGPADAGPYPTVVEYSGYQPSDPDSADLAQLYNAMGFAYVGVNMRGTGCSGGSYRFFETVQNLDGYDTIEAVAAQPWVLDHEVGMVGISYPGITQLFVAATRPPSLNSITPLSVLDDSFRATLYPGGILNTGFAVEWMQQRMDESRPFGQQWTKRRAYDGDTTCAENQKLRLQNPDLVQEIDDNPYYSPVLADSLAPITFVDKIDVPVFLAGAWQDEQTGGHFPAMLDKFTSSPHLYVTLTNGLHTESLTPAVLARYFEFLDLYVAKKVPELATLDTIVPILGAALWGVDDLPPFVDRFVNQTYEQALQAFEAEPSVEILFEQGGNAAFTPGTPVPNFTLSFPSWPIPSATPKAWHLDGNGGLVEGPPAVPGEATYTADPSAIAPTFYTGDGNSIWKAGVSYDWQPIPEATGLGFATAPFVNDTVIAGSGSVDLWIESSAADTDLEATISEVRPDGTEIYVQSGWLRASQRALADTATDLRPAHTNLEADAADLPSGELTPVRVELFPFAHPFRAGSRLRLTIDAPGGNRGIWEFRTIDDGQTVTVAFDAEHPSQLVLAEIPNAKVPAPAPPACGSLRGQPCRPWTKAANGG